MCVYIYNIYNLAGLCWVVYFLVPDFLQDNYPKWDSVLDTDEWQVKAIGLSTTVLLIAA